MFTDDEDDTLVEHLFWIYVGLGIAAFATAFMNYGISVVVSLIALPVGAVLLGKVLQLRDRAMEDQGITGIAQESWSRTSHLYCWSIGYLGCFVIVGLVLIIVQGVQFFKEYNDFASRYC
ncbi:MAG: hypothetical protein MK100_09245 [Phycisphaerales bacterium]|nr:hypothetical protein [Phycisphaerales bacterium]